MQSVKRTTVTRWVTFCFTWLSLLISFSTFAATDCSVVTEISVAECQELLNLYNSTDGENWKNNTGWNETDTPCSWYGVTCRSGHVDGIILSGNKLRGTLPNFKLPNISLIDFRHNEIRGIIPDFDLPNLRVLSLIFNQLNGNVPNFDLPSLQEIGLSNNQLSGVIPNFHSSTLRIIELSSNQLTGNIPNFNLPNLYSLRLAGNKLSGNIPNFNLPNLVYLDFMGNQLTGTIPNLNLPSLQLLALSTNQLSGSIPNFDFLPNLRNLQLSSNKLSGSVPDFNFLFNLSILELSGNQLTGNIPNFRLSNLFKIYIRNNLLSGSIPNFDLPKLQGIGFDRNQLSGAIPNFNLPNLQYLTANNNQLIGSIPDFGATNLYMIDLSNNQLNGNIPNFNLPNLYKLDVGYNQLSGSVPNFNLPKLTSLYLRNNQLGGIIPNFDLSKVSSLYLSRNCGLIAYDSSQEELLNVKDRYWQLVNPACTIFSFNTATVGNGTITGQGINCGDDCSEEVMINTQITLTATPANDSIFKQWAGDCTGIDATINITMDAAKSCTAVFETKPLSDYSFTLNKIGDGWARATIVAASTHSTLQCNQEQTCTKTYPFGEKLTISVSPLPGHQFIGFNGDCAANIKGQGIVIMDAAKTCDINIGLILPPPDGFYTLTIIKSGSGKGIVTVGDNTINCGTRCQSNYKAGSNRYLKAIPDPLSTFIGWQGDCGITNKAGLSVTLDANKQCVAEFQSDNQKAAQATLNVFYDTGILNDGSSPEMTYPRALNEVCLAESFELAMSAISHVDQHLAVTGIWPSQFNQISWYLSNPISDCTKSIKIMSDAHGDYLEIQANLVNSIGTTELTGILLYPSTIPLLDNDGWDYIPVRLLWW